MMYSDYISINKNFQSSINLGLDLNNEKKIDEYIPTKDICDVLRIYINSCLGAKTNKATILMGPYGKGKSFLLLILSYLISNNPDSATYKRLIKKIKSIDEELYSLIKEYNSSKNRLLPVIVNSNYDNLTQAFLLALSEALNREKVPNIIPNTVYSVCVDLIDKWENDHEFSQTVVDKCEKELGTNIEKLKMGLKNYSYQSYLQFETLFSCLTHGIPFNPLINNDIIHIYSDVNHEIKEYGYNGIFIIFDEFSKFLETSNDSLSKELKIIQDFAELANRSSYKEQINICCVTHKSFSLYKADDNANADLFKTVEGRFKEIRFNRSLDENYHIISAAINNEKYKDNISKYIKKEKYFYDSLKSFEPFKRDINTKDLYYGCFPLNPITVYSLIQLCELIAQNERTLFTFICDTDNNSLNSFLYTNDDGLFNVDKIYDYFNPLLRKEEENSIRNIWYRSEAILSKLENQDQKKIIKSLAVILMINNQDEFPASVKNIELATALPKDVVENYVDKLIDSRLLRKNIIDNMLSFASSNSKEIEDRIAIISQSKKDTISYDSYLNEINENQYLLPRGYNEQNKMTRFYKVLFITEDQFNSLSSFDLLKERSFSDGVVLNLIRTTMKEDKIRKKVKEINDNEVIIKYPNKQMDNVLFSELVRYASIQDLINKGGNSDLIASELELLLNETSENIIELVDVYFENDYKFISCITLENESFNAALSEVMSKIYTKKVIFNNELVNKNKISSVYQKSLNNINNDLINRTNSVYSPTSPEATIQLCIIDKMNQPDVKNIIQDIKKSIVNSENKKIKINDIVNYYSLPPYGLRKGIIQILISTAIGEMSDNIIMYIKNKEIDLSAENISKAVYSTDDYYFRASKGTASQILYLSDMLSVFNKESTNNFRSDTKILCDEYRKFFSGLPMFVRNADENSELNIPFELAQFKNIFLSFNLNPYEAVFEKPLEIFGVSTYKKVYANVSEYINNWQDYLNKYKQQMSDDLKKLLSIKKTTSLHMGLNNAVQLKVESKKRPVLNNNDLNVLTTIYNLSYDDKEAINELAYALVGSYIEDWPKGQFNQLVDKLDRFMTVLSKSKKIETSNTTIDSILNSDSNIEYSAMGELFRNNLESVVEEFGDSISTEEKIEVLTSILKKCL